jgi:porphyrinogen peroxidase
MAATELQHQRAFTREVPVGHGETLTHEPQPVGTTVDGQHRIVRIPRRVGRANVRRISNHEREALGGREHGEHLAATDVSGDARRAGVATGQLARSPIDVDLHERPAGLGSDDQADVAHARAQLEHRALFEIAGEVDGPAGLLERPGAWRQHVVVVTDGQAAEGGRALPHLGETTAMANGSPQPGIFAVGTRSHHHLQLDVTGDDDAVLRALGQIRDAASTVAGVNVVVGFGSALWTRVAGAQVPEDFGPFETIEGAGGFRFPADQHDLWLWLHSAGPDAVFNLARLAARCLAPAAHVVREQPAFAYQASQDLTGFEDGTENPPIDDAPSVIAIPGGQPCAGGSVVLLQRWVHDLDGFEQLELADREKVIGRTLHGSVELDASIDAPRAHIRRVVIEDDEGEELEVFRRSTAFGGVQEHGLQFVAFSADRARVLRMLHRMAGVDDGVRDQLTEFSTPTESAWYLAPPTDLLKELL